MLFYLFDTTRQVFGYLMQLYANIYILHLAQHVTAAVHPKYP